MAYSLLSEQLMKFESLPAKLAKLLHGPVRIVNAGGKTVGIFLDLGTMEELEEELSYNAPEFQTILEGSRRSGVVSSASVKKRLKL